MVDVHEKEDTYRQAKAEGSISMSREAFEAIRDHKAKKGDVLGVARIAGIMGAKQNSSLIPLCHNIPLTDCTIEFTLCPPDESEPMQARIHAVCSTSCLGKTGVEMEALTGVSIALLTIYDMCKAIDRGMTIGDIRMIEKQGGKSGYYHNDTRSY